MSYPTDAPLDHLPTEQPGTAPGSWVRGLVQREVKPVPLRSRATRSLHMMAASTAAIALVIASYGSVTAPLSPARQGAVVAVGLALLMSAGFPLLCNYPLRGRLLGKHGVSAWLAAAALGWTAWMLLDAQRAVVAPDTHDTPGCLFRSVVVGLLLGATFVGIWRRTDPFTPRRGGAALGATAGVVAAAAAGVTCLCHGSGHLLWGHWLAVPMLAATGALAGPRWLSP